MMMAPRDPAHDDPDQAPQPARPPVEPDRLPQQPTDLPADPDPAPVTDPKPAA